MAKKKTEKKTEKKEFANLDQMIAAINRKYNDGSILLAGSKPTINMPFYSTGAFTLDIALGIGGIPKGRIVEIYGPESGGKTTLALSISASVQRAGNRVAFIDSEHALDFSWARVNGVNVDDLLISQPGSGEEALGIAEMLATSNQVDMIIVDSVAALTPQVEIDGEMGDSHIGLQARLMSQALRKLVAVCNRSKCTIIFINQIREKIGVMFGSPETTPGGRALKFYASLRMEVRRQSAIKDGDIPVGNKIKAKVVKNKVAPPFRIAEFGLYFGKDGYPSGIDYASSLVEAAEEYDIINKSGSWYSFDGVKIGNGYLAACTYLRQDVELSKTIESKIWEKLGIDIKRDSDEEKRDSDEENNPEINELLDDLGEINNG